ncbi:hypothetical protein ABZ897_23610 [Nonomuraea sp. NPDC046802]|uniref:hypothetical protein n=1 Tax=Nonomuraea sp. NPDC046802 TaxID=3154919 RepID=UPI0033E010A0
MTAADPVKSLRKQFAAGLGVRVSEENRTVVSGYKGAYPTRTTGVIGFGASSAADYDLTSRLKVSPELKGTFDKKDEAKLFKPLRAVKVGPRTYVRGFEWGTMPEGKSWVRFQGDSVWGSYGQRGGQLVDVLDPRVLKAAITKATTHKAGEYRGTLTARDLYADPLAPSEARTISYRLFLNRDRLPVRLVTEYKYTTIGVDLDGKKVKESVHSVTDTRYSGWGTKVKVVAPPARQVVDFDDLEGPAAQEDLSGPITLNGPVTTTGS